MTEHDFMSLSVETKVQDKLQCGKLLAALASQLQDLKIPNVG